MYRFQVTAYCMNWTILKKELNSIVLIPLFINTSFVQSLLNQSISINGACFLSLFYSDVLLMNVSLRCSCIKSSNTEHGNVYSAIRPWTMTSPAIILARTKPDPAHPCYFCMIFMHIYTPCDFNSCILLILSSFHWILAVFVFTHLVAGTIKYKQMLKISLKFTFKQADTSANDSETAILTLWWTARHLLLLYFTLHHTQNV